jgi:hypothetical protein
VGLAKADFLRQGDAGQLTDANLAGDNGSKSVLQRDEIHKRHLDL